MWIKLNSLPVSSRKIIIYYYLSLAHGQRIEFCFRKHWIMFVCEVYSNFYIHYLTHDCLFHICAN